MMKSKPITIEEANNLRGFIFERKYDGSRTLFIDGQLVSDERDGFKNQRYPHILEALKEFKDFIFDGELWVEQDRVTELSKRENWGKAKFIIFDVLKRGDQNLTNMPLKDRRAILEALTFKEPLILAEQYKNLQEAWSDANRHDWEGLIAKQENSLYVNERSSKWLKIKRLKEAVFKVVQWEEGNTHGTFICSDGFINDIRVGALSMNYVNDYLEASRQGKEVMIETQYLNKTNTGHYFHPILKRIIK